MLNKIKQISMTPPPAEKVEGCTWTKAHYDAESATLAGVPWWQNYRVLSIGLLLLTALTVLPFL